MRMQSGLSTSPLRRAAEACTEGAHPALADAALPHDVTLAFGSSGLVGVHASLLDAESMSCESSWAIAEDGKVRKADLELGYAQSMATMVRHNSSTGPQAVTRQLAPQRWAFGWRVDERRVIIAEVRYRAARETPGDADMALVRRLCDARIRSNGQSTLLQGKVVVPPEAANDQVICPAVEGQVAQERRLAGDEGATPASRRGQRWVLQGLCVLALASGGLGYVQWRRSEAMASEAQRLQGLSDATLAQGIAAALGHGDYGEVQVELDHFERLRYFDAAMVVNARGQVVAKSDTAHDVRIGEALKPESVSGSRSLELRNGSARALGRLHIWPYRSAR